MLRKIKAMGKNKSNQRKNCHLNEDEKWNKISFVSLTNQTTVILFLYEFSFIIFSRIFPFWFFIFLYFDKKPFEMLEVSLCATVANLTNDSHWLQRNVGVDLVVSFSKGFELKQN